MNTKSFRKGLREVKVKDLQAVKADIRDILGVYSRQAFAKYSNGLLILDVMKAEAISKAFAKYGVTNCWGE